MQRAARFAAGTRSREGIDARACGQQSRHCTTGFARARVAAAGRSEQRTARPLRALMGQTLEPQRSGGDVVTKQAANIIQMDEPMSISCGPVSESFCIGTDMRIGARSTPALTLFVIFWLSEPTRGVALLELIRVCTRSPTAAAAASPRPPPWPPSPNKSTHNRLCAVGGSGRPGATAM